MWKFNIDYIWSPLLVSGYCMSSIISDRSSCKSTVYERSWSNFNKEKFILDYFEKGWSLILNIEKNYVNHSFDNFLLNINRLLDKTVLIKKVSKY